MTLQIFTRGCYFSLPANVPSNGWHNRNQLNEDEDIFQRIMSEVSSALDVDSFKGGLCL
ncbi:hypothetical protein DPMN_123135 [Dreissena polymorpha]|uniref:Uncharacterized protein n=1 Tax=Dreissena polymorpha TaxID=45954 RepID=A0A9D4GPS4_DREPO|nr:hypothetical protein DPMN_123135 [Dreissena polymorpha]